MLDTNKDLVALVNRDAIADGIASAPVLGRGIGGANPVPILLVGDELPAAVSDYLASTANVRNARKTHLGILAIGGTAVVSDAVMDAAEAAAKTSGDITATIEASKYSVADLVGASIPAGKKVGDYKNEFTVKFSDPVADASVADPTLYRINGRRLEAASDDPTNTEELPCGQPQDRCRERHRDRHLGASARSGRHDHRRGRRPGRSCAERRPASAADSRGHPSARPTTAVDRTAPRIEIIAVAGAATFDVLVHESNVLYNELTVATNLSDFLTVTGASVPAFTNDGGTPDDTADDTRVQRVDRMVAVGQGTNPTATGRSGSGIVRLRFTATATVTATSPNSEIGSATGLIAGDVITVNRNAVRDDDGRANALTRHTVAKLKDQGKFEVSSVSIGNVAPRQP